MGMKSRRKGYRIEREIVLALRDAGFAAERCDLSGGGTSKATSGFDVCLPLLSVDRRVEVKCLANGFRTLYNWLATGPADLLVVRADHEAPLAVVPWPLFIELIQTAESKK